MTAQVVIPEHSAMAYNLAADRNGAGEVVVNVAVTIVPDAEGVELVSEAGRVLMSISPHQHILGLRRAREAAAR